MRAINKKIEYNVLFWSSVGPFLLMLTLFATTLRGGGSVNYLSIAALLGVPLCWAWKWKGFALTLLALVGGGVYLYPQVDDHLWLMGVASTLALGALITTLSFEEVLSVIQALQSQGKNRLDQLLNLDERIKQQEKGWSQEREALELERQQVKELLDVKTAEAEVKEKLAMTLQEECQMLQDLHNALRQQHLSSAEEYGRLKLEFEEIQRVLWKYQEKEEGHSSERMDSLDQLKESLTRREEQLQLLQNLLHEKETIIQGMQQEMGTETAELHREIDEYKTTITRQKMRMEALEEGELKQSQEWEFKYRSLQEEKEKLQGQVAVVPAEPVDQAVRRLEGMYKQLRVQFDEKNEVLHQARKEIFKLETQVMAKEIKDSSLHQTVSHHEREMEGCIAAMTVENKQCEEEIVMLEQLIGMMMTKNG